MDDNEGIGMGVACWSKIISQSYGGRGKDRSKGEFSTRFSGLQRCGIA